MKKFLLILLVVAFAAVLTVTSTGRSAEGLLDKAEKASLGTGVARVEVYAKDVRENYRYISVGSFCIYGCNLANAGIIAADMDTLLGTAVFYEEEFALTDILEAYGAKSLIIQSGENCINVYAYAKGCGYGVEMQGERVNMQIVLKDGETVIGSPLVMGSY